MSYVNADTVLPEELIRGIQKYVNGANLYIPKKRKECIYMNAYRREICERNREIFQAFLKGSSVPELSEVFCLSEKSIYRILNQMKK